ncbi:YczE/YyaS/YitT family protein [Halanaerobacter jeridensis]|uniref:Membrane protein YczE n=1 Tax=Halanaerobacter jeridensis TaxID=706427 RepID=A0A939BNZ4_9FIRM|nr:membrane protein [Halanaerobacter jeridensis]MBM7556297.1 putative membrane protein YczE [Halanaerobacter jeridensis]
MEEKNSWLRFTLGLIIVSIGIVLTVKAHLGVSPWNVFHIGLTNHFSITLGQASQLTGLVIIIMSFLIAKIKPTIATVINMFLVGFLIDIIMPWIAKPNALVMRYLYLICGVIVFSFGVGVYISGECGTGPRDSLMMALDRKLNYRLAVIRNSIEFTVLVVGYFLGRPVGIGTIVVALSVGPIVEKTLMLMKKLFKSCTYQPDY